SRRLALAEGLTDEQARALAAEGKAVVWVDGGLHATEVLGAQQLIETVWQMVSRDDAETKRFLSDVILLCCLVNSIPSGLTRQQSRITSLRERFVSASSRLTICQTVSISCCAPRTSVACNPPS